MEQLYFHCCLSVYLSFSVYVCVCLSVSEQNSSKTEGWIFFFLWFLLAQTDALDINSMKIYHIIYHRKFVLKISLLVQAFVIIDNRWILLCPFIDFYSRVFILM